MAEESIGTARIDVVVGTNTMDAGIEAAKRRVSGLGTEAEQQFNKASASTKRYADSLLRQADMLGKTRAEQIAYNAQMRIGGDLGDKIAAKALAQQTAMSAGLGVTGKSAKELQFALRGLPAQITDIGVSLASGQRPMMVLLQQGGQLKDMFGGIVPAAKAMGSSLLALINPYTLAAAAVAVLGAAFVQAENDQSAFAKALITTGGYAGKTTSQLEAMVGVIASTADATQGTAREAIQKVAETGKFTGEQFELVVQAAAHMESATGQSIDDTIKKFVELGKAPVDTLIKLNETEHFLTEAQLDRVKALAAEGNQQEAAAEAARIYATRLDDVADAAEAARPHLSQMWKEAKEGASSAWAEAKNFAEFMAAAADKAKEVPWYQRLGPVGGLRTAFGSLYGAEPVAPARIVPVAGAVDSAQAKAQGQLEKDAAKFKDQYLTREEEKKRAITELDKFRAQYTEQEYQSLKKQIDLRFTDKAGAKKAEKMADFWATPIGNDPHVDLTKEMDESIKAYKKEAEQWARSTSAAAAYKSTLDDMLATRQRAIDLQVQSIGMGQREAEQQQALIGIDEDYNRKKADLQKRQQNATSQLDKEGYQQQLDDLAKYHDQRIQMEVDGWRRANEARLSFSNGAKSALADFTESAHDIAGQTHNIFTNAFDGMADALAKFVTTGKLDFADLANSIIADLVKMEARILVSQALQSIFGGYGGTNGQGGVTYNEQGFVNHVYANGGVVDGSRNLSAYSGSVVTSPTLFAFAKGNGLMGEAGPEAIMPLTRGPNGKLGVQSSGGGEAPQVEINITNNGQAVQAQQTGQRTDGKKVIIDMVLEAVANDVASGGKVAKAGQQRFGWQRRGVPVGGA